MAPPVPPNTLSQELEEADDNPEPIEIDLPSRSDAPDVSELAAEAVPPVPNTPPSNTTAQLATPTLRIEGSLESLQRRKLEAEVRALEWSNHLLVKLVPSWSGISVVVGGIALWVSIDQWGAEQAANREESRAVREEKQRARLDDIQDRDKLRLADALVRATNSDERGRVSNRAGVARSRPIPRRRHRTTLADRQGASDGSAHREVGERRRPAQRQ